MIARSSDVAGAGLSRRRGVLTSVRVWSGGLELYVPAAVLAALILYCFFWPMVAHVPRPVGGSVLQANKPVGSAGHLLGTDQVGNDIFSRLLYGGRVSMEVGAATQAIGLVIGVPIGVTAGFLAGAVDAVLMRILDALIAFPSLVLVLAIADGLGPSELHVIWALSIFSIPACARVARAATLRIREQPFMIAARMAGTKTQKILARHVIPNIAPGLLTFSLLGAGIAILLEGTLSYLGYGIPDPGPSWGNMIADGQSVLSVDPTLVLVPSLCLLGTVIALNVLGDALRTRWGVR